jgi:hypothetical protein
MPLVSLQAHFDGKQIVLDEPYELPVNAGLVITLLPEESTEITEAAWLKGVAASDAFAFLADPNEDIYTAVDGEPFHSGNKS